TRCYRDWSSDVCSSDLSLPGRQARVVARAQGDLRAAQERSQVERIDQQRGKHETEGGRADIAVQVVPDHAATQRLPRRLTSRTEIGRASCRERGEVAVG